MKAKTNFIKKGATVLLGGMLVLAFSPLAFAPAALAASTPDDYSLVDVDTASAMIQTALDQNNPAENSDNVIGLYDNVILKNKAEDVLTNDQLQYVIACESYQRKLASNENSSLEKQVKTLKGQLEKAQSQISKSDASTLKAKTKISKLAVTASGMGKLTASWTVKNPVDGAAYQVKYTKLGSKSTTTTAKTAKKTVKKLSGGSTYTFQVRAYKKINGKNVYGKWSKKASARVVPTYKKGSYTVKGDLLFVRKSASTSAKQLAGIPRGTKVKITKLKVANGAAWGKVTYMGQTGWVQMQYLK